MTADPAATAAPWTVHALTVAGRRVRALEAGTGPAVVLLHGGWAGTALYCGAAEIWDPMARLLTPHHRVVAIDLPGSGGSEVHDPADLSVAACAETVTGVVAQLGLGAVHLVGHAEGGLLALRLAGEAPELVRSCTLVQALPASPVGDSIRNVHLLHPPAPLFSARSQTWALDRLSVTPHHIDDHLVQTLAAHSEGPAHRSAMRLLADEEAAHRRRSDLANARRQVFARARAGGFTVPIDLVWATDDPLSGVDFAAATLDYLSTTEEHLALTLVTRTGHFPFREDPAAVARVVEATVRLSEPALT